MEPLDPVCVHQQIAAIAAQMPDAIAVTVDADHFTYAALHRAAGAFAARLRAADVDLEARVAVALDRSFDLVVALLGTLDAGGAYVPIDLNIGPERFAALLRDAGARCLVTSEKLRARLPALTLPICLVDDPAPADPAVGFSPGTPPRASAPDGDTLAYVLYTSGTTGEPKGVAVSHAALHNILTSMQRTPGLTAADALLAVTPITFDIAALEIWLPLITGARLVIAPPHSAADGPDLRARLAREHISVLQATPATWHLLLDAGWQAPDGFKVLCGGEPLPPELARRLLVTAGHVWNCYGPTETTIWSTLDRIDSADGPITIGHPIAHTRVYLLDRALEPVPIGVLGDLYIAGAGLARGYLNRPDLTAATFRPDPFSTVPGQRMYATGDVARYRSDGRIDCRGRRDHQVKLHGRRIELEAIGHVLNAHPLVRESVAAVCEDTSRGRFLAAYVAARDGARTVRADLRDHLIQRLPSYMVPSAYVILDALPRTRHNKIDRRALPPPVDSDFCAAREFVAPRTPSEHALGRAWCDVLGVSAVGVDDDFFALGGNSLQAARVLWLVRVSLGADLSMQVFFGAPRLGALAERIDRALRDDTRSAIGPVARIPRHDTLALAPQQESWWFSAFLTGNISPSNTLFGLRLVGSLQPAALHQAVAAVQNRHEALRTSFREREDGSAVPVVSAAESCPLRLQTVDLSSLEGGARERVLLGMLQSDNDRPFALGAAPLCRAILVKLHATEHVVTFNMPYLVCDGGSVNVVLDDLCALYTAAVSGRPVVMPELPTQYVDFAQWQREWLDSAGAAAQLAYWRERLAPPWPDLLPNPASAVDDETSFFSIQGVLTFSLRAEAAEAARRLARSERCTLFATMMAALNVALYERSGERDVRIGTLVANRSVLGAEKVVGLFANTVCLRTRMEAGLRFGELVRTLHAAIGEATAHQELPFEIVARTLEAEHGIPRSKLFQVMVFWGLATPSLPFPDLQTIGCRLEDQDSVILARRSLVDLRIAFTDTSAAIAGSITYRLSLFSTPEIRALVDALERCLIAAVVDPAITVEALCAGGREQVTALGIAAGERLARVP